MNRTKPTGVNSPRFLTIAQAAEDLNVSRWTIQRAIAAGKLSTVLIGRSRRINAASLEAFLERNRAA